MNMNMNKSPSKQAIKFSTKVTSSPVYTNLPNPNFTHFTRPTTNQTATSSTLFDIDNNNQNQYGYGVQSQSQNHVSSMSPANTGNFNLNGYDNEKEHVRRSMSQEKIRDVPQASANRGEHSNKQDLPGQTMLV